MSGARGQPAGLGDRALMLLRSPGCAAPERRAPAAADAQRTVMVPSIPGCTVHTYSIFPAFSAVHE